MNEKLDFISRLRAVASVLGPVAPGISNEPVNGGAPDPSTRSAGVWFSPKVVDGFEPSFFPELSLIDQQNLATSVDDFRALTSRPPSGAPDALVQERAKQDLIQIVSILRPYVLPNEATLAIWRSLYSSLSSLDYVVAVFPEIEEDSSGEDAVFVTVVLDDSVLGSEDFSDKVERARSMAKAAVRAQTNEQWPYIEFRSLSEHREFVEALQ